MIHRADPHPRLDRIKSFFSRYPQVIVYSLILGVFFFSLWLDNENQKEDQARADQKAANDFIDRCKAAVDTRNVDRDQTQRIYTLAVGTISTRDEQNLTRAQKKQIHDYIKRVEDFRKESFATIKPSKLCIDYVDDDNVTPEQWEKEHPPNQLKDDEPGDNQ